MEELANKRINKVQNLSKQTDCNNLTYHFQGKSNPKNSGFKSPKDFYKNIKDSYITLKQKKNKKNLNQI